MLCSQATAARAFSRAVQTYIECHHLPTVSAIQLEGGSRKWTPQSGDYIADVEIATRRVLKTPELWHQWCCLVRRTAGLPADSVPDSVSAQIVAACGQIYHARALDNSFLYFRKVKKGSAA